MKYTNNKCLNEIQIQDNMSVNIMSRCLCEMDNIQVLPIKL